MGDGIRTPDQRLRVFVSSTLGELAPERAAAREAIEQLRLAPVMFELGARPHPPRALYRSYLEQSDVFVGIYWQRYGWVAPDMNMSGLEDEFRLSAGRPRLMYLKRPAPDMEPGLRALLDELEADGSVSYRSFRDPDELRQVLLDDLAVMLAERFDAAARAPADVARASQAALPQPATPLVGREKDVEAVARLLADGHRLVTLTGVGGIGKTRLAVAVLERQRTAVDAYFVDLTATAQAAGVLDVIATTCGALAEGRETQMEAVVRRLQEPALLVLDNFEHVTDAAPVIAQLLQQCPRLSAVVTSRAVLHLRGEQEWPVLPLGLTDDEIEVADAPAVQLFVERAREARPNFELTRDNAADVAELCKRLDGLPLALELVAPRVRMLTPRQILDRLGQQLDLAGPFADLPERQRTLGTTLDWSYNLLPAQAQRLLGRLAAFSGPFSFDSVERVCGWDDVDVVEALSTLVDHSLVNAAERSDGEPAFRMLETVKAYSLQRLDEHGERDEVFVRLRDYIIGTVREAAPRLHTAEQAQTMRRLDAEVGNLLSVTAWIAERGAATGGLLEVMSDAWVFWQVRGHFRRMPELLPLLEGAGVQMTERDRCALYFAHAGNLFTSGRYDDLLAFLPDVIPVIRQVSGPMHAGMLTLLSAVSRPYEQRDLARAEFAAAERDLRNSRDRTALIYCLSHVGALWLVEGDVAAARNSHAEALTIAEELGDVNMQAEARVQLAHDAVADGHTHEVRDLVIAAGRLYRAIDHREGMAYCLGAAAGLAVVTSEPERAARLLGAASATRDTVGIVAWPLVGVIEQRYADQARAALGMDRFDEEYARGAALSLDDALDAAVPAPVPGR